MSSKFQNQPWIRRLALLFGTSSRRPALRPTRRLVAESLESRCVLADLPVDGAALSLSDYLAQSSDSNVALAAESPVAPPNDASAPAATLSFVSEPANGDACGGFAPSSPATSPLESGAEGEPTDTLVGGPPTGGGGSVQNLPPEIAALTLTTDAGFLVIRGSINDELPGDCTVAFSGLVSGVATVDGQGNFEFRVELPLLPGTLHAVAADGYGTQSVVWSELFDLN